MQVKYDDKKIKLTDRYIKAVKELLQAELEMMANYDKAYSDCWVKGFAIIEDIARANGISFYFNGNDDWKPIAEPGQVVIEVKRRLKKSRRKQLKMPNQDFTEISKRYQETSTIQSSAADSLFALLNFKQGEAVLDVGCGTGNLTKRILDITNSDTVGVDLSLGMILEAIDIYGTDITFNVKSAENINFNNEFDVVFCNSSFQWLKNPSKAIDNFYKALKPNGRIGIQAPGTYNYCPNFLQAVNALKHNDKTKDIYSKFVSPWFFLNSAEDYTALFLKHNFYVAFSTIQTVETYHSPEEVYSIFASGAIAGYLNKEYYECDLTEDYINEFNRVVKEEFYKQAIYDGKVKLVFNRIYLVAVK